MSNSLMNATNFPENATNDVQSRVQNLMDTLPTPFTQINFVQKCSNCDEMFEPCKIINPITENDMCQSCQDEYKRLMKLMNYDLIKKENFHKRLANGGPVALRIAVLNKKLRNLIHEFVRKNINEKENEKVDKVLDQCIRDNREVILELQSKFKEWRGQEHTWINVILMD